MMKRFRDFIKEDADIEDIQGLEDDFIPKSQQWAKQKLGVRADDPSQLSEIGPELSRLLSKSKELLTTDSSGKRLAQVELIERLASLSDLAEKLIQNQYRDLIQTAEESTGRRIIFDIQILPSGSDVFGDIPKLADKPAFPEKRIGTHTPTDIKYGVSKNKIIDMMGQGSGYELEEVMKSFPELEEKLDFILGGGRGKEFKNLSLKTMETGNRADWAFPSDPKAQAIKNSPQGTMGASYVDWQKDPKQIWIIARGVDFALILHEAIKALVRLAPKAVANTGDVEREGEIKKYTSSYRDESDDFKYGRPAREMFRLFAQKCIDEYSKKITDQNMVEYIFIELSRHPKNGGEYGDKLFLTIIVEIFSVFDIQGGKFIIDRDKFSASSAKYQIMGILDMITRNWPEGGDVIQPGKEEEVDDIEELKRKTAQREEDLSNLSRKEIMDLIDGALDERDFKRAEELGKFLKK
jgi:hypothetical protein